MTAGFTECPSKGISDNHYLGEWVNHPDVEVVTINDVYDLRNSHSELRQVADLQIKYSIDYTLFAFADMLTFEFISLALPWTKQRLNGRNYAIFFLLSNRIYKQSTGRSLKHILSQGFKGLRHYIDLISADMKVAFFLNFVLRHFRILDGSFFLDEYFVRKLNCGKIHYLPDPFKPFKDPQPLSGDKEYLLIERAYTDFLQLNKNRDIILKFGNESDRHGVNYLVRLVDQHPDLVYVHLGETTGHNANEKEFKRLKNKLFRQGRIFEIDRWVSDRKVIDLFFESVKYVLLPYERHYGSSGIMLDSLSYGKAVLVPDVGLMGARVVDHHLGLTYEHLSYESFHEQFRVLMTKYKEYSKVAKRYVNQNFSQDERLNALNKMR